MTERKPYQPSFLSPDGTKPDTATVSSLRQEELGKYFHTQEQLNRAMDALRQDPRLTPSEIFSKLATEDRDDPVNDAHQHKS